jgi:7-cyano-7-deazaguanine synthase
MALDAYPGNVTAVAFDYGQRHRIELEQAGLIAKMVGVSFRVIDCTWMAGLSQNSLTSIDIPIAQSPGELPNTFVDGRNLFFLSIAAVIAKQQAIHTLYTGVCETDFSGYPDCRNAFIRSLEATLRLALDYTIDIQTPLMWLSKADTVRRMQTLGKLDWYAHTHTCYEGLRPACGTCPACLLRLRGFKDAGVVDPIPYL